MNPKVDWYFTKAGQWQEEVEKLRMIVLDCGLAEELKWGCPCYTFSEGKKKSNIVLIHVFKEYCALLLFKGVLLKDPDNILIQQTENVQVARQIRFTGVKQIVELEKVLKRHEGLEWEKVQAKLEAKPGKLWSLDEMELTEGEPDVVGYDKQTDEYIFYDCSAESPKGRRSLCYDRQALDSRKEHKPANSAIDMAAEMGIELLSEYEYRELQKLGKFDLKTSSWVKTPSDIRELGGAIFCDRRY